MAAKSGATLKLTKGNRSFGAARLRLRAVAVPSAAGSDVVVNTLQDRGAAERVAAEIEATGRRSLVQIADVVDRSAVDQMVQKACEAFGSIDILVCNASSRGQIDFSDLDHAAWRRVIDISLDGAFHCAQATLPGMIAKGWGRIITLGGIPWHAGFKRRAHNLTGKSGLTGLTRALAVEFGDRGITANVIAPGAVATAMPASAGTPPCVSACHQCLARRASTRSRQRLCSLRTQSKPISTAKSFTSTAVRILEHETGAADVAAGARNERRFGFFY
jgi:3-oxoacyl-[acyl-carrier protein] reductase